MRILVLGGTAWVGGVLAANAAERGHEVVCLARGSAPAPSGTRLVRADRERPDAYDAVRSERWDAVLDVARDPAQVRSAVAALTGARWWGFVSTGNVYADTATPHLDESAALLDPDAEPADPGQAYGMGKAACERAVVDAVGDRALVARAGLIGGPGDTTGRSGWWPWRFAHPAADAVLVPDAPRAAVELLDVRDLADWMLAAAESGAGGVFNAVGEEHALDEHLAIAAAVAGRDADVVRGPEAWLLERGVQEWMGPRSLPLWLADPDWQGFTRRDGFRARAAGLTHRPLEDTLRDALRWEEDQPQHPHGAGLSDADELALLAALP